MTWTYNNDPTNNNRDAVRFLVGDTNFGAQMVLDEEITFALSEEGNVHAAASLIAKAIAGKFASSSDRAIGDLKISFSQRQKQYLDLAEQLRHRGDVSGGRAFAGGISKSEKTSEEQDTDRAPPAFERGMHDNVGTQDGDSNNTGSDSI